MGGGKKDKDSGRKSVTDKYEPSGRKSRIPAAYPVTMLVDLQVFVVPREKWVLSRRLYRHNIVEEGISFGFIRVLPQLSVHNLRRELAIQLGQDIVPRDFVFVRSVGNIFVQLKPKQEIELKVKNFLPPFTSDPEIYLLEVLPSDDLRMLSPLPLLLREETPPHICHDLCHHSRARTLSNASRATTTTSNFCPECHALTNNEVFTSTLYTKEIKTPGFRDELHTEEVEEELIENQRHTASSPRPQYHGGEEEEDFVENQRFEKDIRIGESYDEALVENRQYEAIERNQEDDESIERTEHHNTKFINNEHYVEHNEQKDEEEEAIIHRLQNLLETSHQEETSASRRTSSDHGDHRRRSSVRLVHQDSIERSYTESPSSPETVIHVDPDDPDGPSNDTYQSEFSMRSTDETLDPALLVESNTKTYEPEYQVASTHDIYDPEYPVRSEETYDHYEEDFETYDETDRKASTPPETDADQNQPHAEVTEKVKRMYIPIVQERHAETNNPEVESYPQNWVPITRRIRSGSGKRKPKRLVYPDPRRPSNYPQRLNKVTLARQALAREKRRVYIEDRIQKYLQKSVNTKRHSQKTRLPPLPSVAEGQDGTASYNSPPSLIDLQLVKLHHSHSLPDLDSTNYYINNPNQTLLGGHISTPTSIPVARVLTRRSPFKSLPSPSVPLPSLEPGNSSSSHGDRSEISRSGTDTGYYYSFRVRENGVVQMFDKSIQTVHSEFSHGYTLEFKEETSKVLPPIQAPTVVDIRDKNLREITENVQLRHDAELRRAELVQRANDLQTKIKEKRDKITRRHEFWHKKYIEESALTRPLEASCNSLRAELNTVHRRLLAHLEGRDLPLRLRDGPSKKANYKIMAARLQHEIKELQQKVKAAKLRLESEIKLKEQADRETREMRKDLSNKKVVMSLARSQAVSLPVVHPISKPLPYEHYIPRTYDPIHSRTYDPLHSRSYESLYSRVYDPLGY